jgi:hypothetical protein
MRRLWAQRFAQITVVVSGHISRAGSELAGYPQRSAPLFKVQVDIDSFPYEFGDGLTVCSRNATQGSELVVTQLNGESRHP